LRNRGLREPFNTTDSKCDDKTTANQRTR
jgi:hypothetical protein